MEAAAGATAPFALHLFSLLFPIWQRCASLSVSLSFYLSHFVSSFLFLTHFLSIEVQFFSVILTKIVFDRLTLYDKKLLTLNRNPLTLPYYIKLNQNV